MTDDRTTDLPDDADPYQTDRLQVAQRDTEAGVPDRDDTGGGPRGGNTVDGRTGPGQTGAQGAPESTLRSYLDFSGDGNLGTEGGSDELRPLGGWPDEADKTAAQKTLEGDPEE